MPCLQGFFVDVCSNIHSMGKNCMEPVVKKALLLLSLVFICALLSAMDFDDAIDDAYLYGQLTSIGGDNYWVAEGFLASKGDAYGYVAYMAGLVLYVQADWETPSDSNCESELKSVEYVGGYWYDEEDDIEYMISIPMDGIMDEFETEASYEMDFNDLVDEILEYVYYFGDESAF